MKKAEARSNRVVWAEKGLALVGESMGTPYSLCKLLGISHDKLCRILEHPEGAELKEALALRQSEVVGEIELHVLQMALGNAKGDRTCALAILNNRGSEYWSQKQELKLKYHGFAPPKEEGDEERPKFNVLQLVASNVAGKSEEGESDGDEG